MRERERGCWIATQVMITSLWRTAKKALVGFFGTVSPEGFLEKS